MCFRFGHAVGCVCLCALARVEGYNELQYFEDLSGFWTQQVYLGVPAGSILRLTVPREAAKGGFNLDLRRAMFFGLSNFVGKGARRVGMIF